MHSCSFLNSTIASFYFLSPERLFFFKEVKPSHVCKMIKLLKFQNLLPPLRPPKTRSKITTAIAFCRRKDAGSIVLANLKKSSLKKISSSFWNLILYHVMHLMFYWTSIVNELRSPTQNASAADGYHGEIGTSIVVFWLAISYTCSIFAWYLHPAKESEPCSFLAFMRSRFLKPLAAYNFDYDRNKNYCNLKYFPSFSFFSLYFSFNWAA